MGVEILWIGEEIWAGRRIAVWMHQPSAESVRPSQRRPKKRQKPKASEKCPIVACHITTSETAL